MRADLPDGPALIIKGVHRCGGRAYIDLLVNDLTGNRPMRKTSVPFRGLEASDLELAMRDHGAACVRVYGGYRDQAYVRQQSTDLIMVAEK